MRRVTSTLISFVFVVVALPSPASSTGPVTRYLEPLRAHRQNLQRIRGEIDRLRGAPKPQSPEEAKARAEEARAAGNALLAEGAAFRRTYASFMRGETRRGLMEEVDLVSTIAHELNEAVAAYREVVGAKIQRLPRRRGSHLDRDLQVFIGSQGAEFIDNALVREGVRDLATARNWVEARQKVVEHGRQAINQELDKAAERYVGIAFHDARSLRRGLRVRANKEVSRYFSKVLLRITDSDVVLWIGRELIIPWLTQHVLNEIAKLFRGKHTLEERLPVSIESLRSAALRLNSLPPDAHLDRVAREMQRARYALAATRYLARDLERRPQLPEATMDLVRRWKMSREILEHSIERTRFRFLLDREGVFTQLRPLEPVIGDALSELQGLIHMVKPMLEGVAEMTPESEVLGSWTFGRVGGAVLCTVHLTKTPGGPGHRLQACHANESYWKLESPTTIAFFHSDGAPTSRLTRVSKNCWRGPYLGHPSLPSDGTVHYIRRGPESETPACR